MAVIIGYFTDSEFILDKRARYILLKVKIIFHFYFLFSILPSVLHCPVHFVSPPFFHCLLTHLLPSSFSLLFCLLISSSLFVSLLICFIFIPPLLTDQILKVFTLQYYKTKKNCKLYTFESWVQAYVWLDKLLKHLSDFQNW